MKFKLQIVLTNWINLVGMAAVVLLWGMIDSMFFMNNVHDAPPLLVFGFLSGLWLLFYGMLPMTGFICGIVILDVLLVNRNKTNLNAKLILEWIIISAPFAYWTYKYIEWPFAIAIVAFLFTQFVRKRHIIKVIDKP